MEIGSDVSSGNPGPEWPKADWSHLLVSRAELDGMNDSLEAANIPSVIDCLRGPDTATLQAALDHLGERSRFVRVVELLDPRGSDLPACLSERGYRPTEARNTFVLFPRQAQQDQLPCLDLFAEYHRFGWPDRDTEIEGALADNLDLPFVRRLILVYTEHHPPTKLAEHMKCEPLALERRHSTQELFALADDLAESRCRILVNSDIVLDADCFRLPAVMGNPEFYALRRREVDGALNPRGGLDAWCWTGTCRIVGADFELGRLNCDLRLNHLAREAYGEGFSCPSLTFTTHHRHESGLRPGTSNLATRGLHNVPGERIAVNATRHPFDAASRNNGEAAASDEA